MRLPDTTIKKGRQIAIHDTDNGRKDSLNLQATARSSGVVEDRVMAGHSLPKIRNSCHPEWTLLVANRVSQGILPSQSQTSSVFKTL